MPQIIEPQQFDAGKLRVSALGVTTTLDSDATNNRVSAFSGDAGLLRVSAIGVSLTQTADESTFTQAATVSGSLMMGVYTSAADTLSDSKAAVAALDVNRNLKITLATLLAGEDLTLNRLRVQQANSYNNLTTSSPTNVKAAAGFLHRITFNQPFPNILKIYDNTTAATTLIATVSGGLAISAGTGMEYNVNFGTGLTLSATSGTPDITISYI